MERIRERPSLPSSGVLRPASPFADLADLWLADLDVRDLAGNTKENYRTCLRLHVRPAFEVVPGLVELGVAVPRPTPAVR